jgi:rhodanese-related sulfurtransferase
MNNKIPNSESINSEPFQRIDVAKARDILKRPDVLLLDCRTRIDFQRDGMVGAQHLCDANAGDYLMGKPTHTPVLIYCYHGISSQYRAQMFIDFGFTEVYSLDGGYDAWCAANQTNHPALSEALQNWLITEGFAAGDPHSALPNGMTPLMRAARAGDPALVEELLAVGVDPLKCNADGNQALWLACVGENLDIVVKLIAAGCAIDHQNDNGATCLMYASSTGSAAVVKHLLAMGANPNLATPDDFTALDMASSLECLNLLCRKRTYALA